jgi:hypothetical protein
MKEDSQKNKGIWSYVIYENIKIFCGNRGRILNKLKLHTNGRKGRPKLLKILKKNFRISSSNLSLVSAKSQLQKKKS